MVHILFYMDGMVIRNDTFKNHMDILYYIKIFFKKYGMEANAVKFEWSRNSISYLGFVVTLDGINPQP